MSSAAILSRKVNPVKPIRAEGSPVSYLLRHKNSLFGENISLFGRGGNRAGLSLWVRVATPKAGTG